MPDKLGIKRDEFGKILPGSKTLNPAGRPKGKTLKEFAREMLMTMNDEEKLEYLKKLPPEIVWRMSEGNPHNTQDIEARGEGFLINFINFKKDEGDSNSK